MAYGVKWRLEFEDELGRAKRVDILKKDYTGSITSVTGAGFSPLFTSIQNQGDPKYETVRGTEIELKVYAEIKPEIDYTLSNNEIYWVEEYSPTSDLNLVKATFDNTTGSLTNTYERLVMGDAGATNLASVNSGNCRLLVLSSGNIGLMINDGADTSFHLFDNDFTLINELYIDTDDYRTQGRNDPFSIDEDDNIYIALGTTVNDNFTVRKYDSSLNLIWESQTFDDGRTVLLTVTRNNVVFTHSSLSDSFITAISRSDGSFIKTTPFAFGTNSTSAMCTIPGDKVFFTIQSGPGIVCVADENLNDIDSTSADSISNFDDTAAGGAMYASENKVYVYADGNNETLLLYDYESKTVDWKLQGSSLSITEPPNTISKMQDGRVVIATESAGTSDRWIIDPAVPEEVIQVSNSGTEGDDDAGHKMLFDNWVLRDESIERNIDFSEIITATDTDYKIEIYEDDNVPDAPTNFQATVTHPDVDFTWNAVSGADGYNVYLDSGSGFVKHNSSTIITTSYGIDGLTTGEYSAYVKAVNDGLESEESNEEEFLINIYYTDFSEYTTSTQPSDWTRRFVLTGNDWTVEDDVSATGSKILRFNTQSSTGRRGLSWDVLDSVSADMEIEFRVKPYVSSSSNTMSQQDAFVRGVGSSSNETLYAGGFRLETAGIGERDWIIKYNAGSFSTLEEISTSLVNEAWNYIKFRCEGTSLKLKAWTEGDTEPASWDIEQTDGDITSAGWVGLFSFTQGQTDIDWFKATKL